VISSFFHHDGFDKVADSVGHDRLEVAGLLRPQFRCQQIHPLTFATTILFSAIFLSLFRDFLTALHRRLLTQSCFSENIFATFIAYQIDPHRQLPFVVSLEIRNIYLPTRSSEELANLQVADITPRNCS
jgi:hypothetical protein